MAMRVIEEECEFTDNSGIVVLESDHKDGGSALSELRGPRCRTLALQYASTRGLNSPGVSGNVDTYPVDEAGKAIVDPRGAVMKAFRASVPVTRKLL